MNLDYLWGGFAVALTTQNLLIGLVGCFLGTMIGALPAIGPINGIKAVETTPLLATTKRTGLTRPAPTQWP